MLWYQTALKALKSIKIDYKAVQFSGETSRTQVLIHQDIEENKQAEFIAKQKTETERLDPLLSFRLNYKITKREVKELLRQDWGNRGCSFANLSKKDLVNCYQWPDDKSGDQCPARNVKRHSYFGTVIIKPEAITGLLMDHIFRFIEDNGLF